MVEAVAYLRALRGAKAAYVPERLAVQRPGPDGHMETATLAIDVDAFASAAWRKILRDGDRPGMLVRRHLEVCVFSYLAAELRSGDIAVAGSDSYASLHDQLMSWEECRPLVDAFCAQAGIPADPAALTAHFRSRLAEVAARVDAGYPSNTDLVLEGGRPVLRRRKGADRRPEALRLEAAIHDRLPQRALLDILTRTAYLLGWHHHFGPASGSDPKIRDTLARYVLTVFAHGTLLGPAQVAAHMHGQVSVHELTLAANKHATAAKIEKASATVINAFSKLDVTAMWGDGKTAAADGSQIDTWKDNLLAETSIRYGTRRHRLPADLRHLRRAVLPVHPLRGLGGRLPAGPAAVQRLGDPARISARRHPGPVAAGVRPGRASGVRAPSQDPQLARPELLPPRPADPLQAHRLPVRRQRHRLGPAGEALARPATHRDIDPGGSAVLGDAAAPAGQPLPAQAGCTRHCESWAGSSGP